MWAFTALAALTTLLVASTFVRQALSLSTLHLSTSVMAAQCTTAWGLSFHARSSSR